MTNKTCKSCKHFEYEAIGFYDGGFALLCNRNGEYYQYYLGNVSSLYDIDRDYDLETCWCYEEVQE